VDLARVRREVTMNKLHSDVTAPLRVPQVQFSSADRSTPLYSRQAVFAVGGLALVTMAAVAVMFMAFAVAAGSRIPFRIAAIGAGLGVPLGLAIGLNIFERMALQTESIENKPPVVMEAPAPAQTTVVWLIQNGERRRHDFDIPPDLLTEWCLVAYREQSLAFGSWVPRFCKAFGGHGREKFEGFRKEWIRRKLGRDAGGNTGLCLTDKGWTFCEDLLTAQGQLRVTDVTPPLPALQPGDLEHGASIHPHTDTQEKE
jgi:hypothetical protein